MSTAFDPMSAADQSRFRSAYLAYLHARDGTPDLDAQRFDLRERFFAGVDAQPQCWCGPPPVDQRVFDRNHERRVPERGLDERTLWALATAKTNRAERFGVDFEIAHNGKPPDAANDPHAYIMIEELYHTRILRDALATIGLTVEIGRPNAVTRAMVNAMVRLPSQMSDVFVLCGEIVGVAIFTLLLEKARALFADQPAVLARIETLFAQIMVDEVGHVHFVRSRLGPARLAVAKRVLPVVVWGVMRDIPELALLCGRDRLMQTAARGEVDTAAAGYADRFVFA